MSYPCDPGCGRSFPTAEGLKAHRLNSAKHNFCIDCNEDFYTKDDLDFHDIRIHGYCDVCDEFLHNYGQLTQHRRDEAEHLYCPYPDSCDRTPEYQFNSERHLEEHLQSSAHRPTSFPCPFKCSIAKKYASLSAVAAHIVANGCSMIVRDEFNELVYQLDTDCVIVDRRKGPGDGISRERIEDNLYNAKRQRKYVCEICETDFSTYAALEAHLRSSTHEADMYLCTSTSCASMQRFTTFSGICQHLASTESGAELEVMEKKIWDLLHRVRRKHNVR